MRLRVFGLRVLVAAAAAGQARPQLRVLVTVAQVGGPSSVEARRMELGMVVNRCARATFRPQ